MLHAHNEELHFNVEGLEVRLGKVTTSKEALSSRVEELTQALDSKFKCDCIDAYMYMYIHASKPLAMIVGTHSHFPRYIHVLHVHVLQVHADTLYIVGWSEPFVTCTVCTCTCTSSATCHCISVSLQPLTVPSPSARQS